MKATRIAIVGYGNVGRGVYKALERNPDMSLAGIISRDPNRVRNEFGNTIVPITSPDNLRVINADVAILCGGSKDDLPKQGPFFVEHYNTVDSFDTHAKIPEYFHKIDEFARKNGKTSIISAGWDPGTFSVNRVLMDAFLPGTIPKAFYGLGETGGLSMGHSDAVRQVKGVKDARQYTHAIPEAIERVRDGENPDLSVGEMHWRECYVVAESDDPGEMERISDEIISMPNYFKPYKTKVHFVTQEILDKQLSGMPHDGLVLAVGETGNGNKAMIEYRNEWESNPEATGNVLIACARACKRFNNEGKNGAYTMLDIPTSYLSPHSNEKLLKDFM